jgi:predicted outer membrane repeat protein
MNPSDIHAYPADDFIISSLHAHLEQTDSDLYVNPQGDDTNSGFSSSDPLSTIAAARAKILLESTNPRKIHLAEGIYSPSRTGENFPIYVPSYTILAGDSHSTTILDAEGTGSVVVLDQVRGSGIRNLTLTGGYSRVGGGINCIQSNAFIQNVTVSENSTYHDGGGIYLEQSDDVTLSSVIIEGNTSSEGGGIYINESNPILRSVTVRENWSRRGGGGLYLIKSAPSISNVVVVNNTTDAKGGGIFAIGCDGLALVHSTVSDNASVSSGGGLCCGESSVNIINSIFWNNQPDEIWHQGESAITAVYSAISSGRMGEGNVHLDPLFTNPEMGDYSLLDDSPCIDAGAARYILDGDTLVNMGVTDYYGRAPDIGAFEVFTTPAKFTLYQNYPNPFNEATTVVIDISEPTHASLVIYDLRGKELVRLVDDHLSSDRYIFQWHSTAANGKNLPSGIYIARLETPEYSKSIKMVLLK